MTGVQTCALPIWFFYPRRGFGQISEAYRQAAVAAGAEIHLGASLCEIDVGSAGALVRAESVSGPQTLACRRVFSTIPLPLLVRALRPAAPAEVLAAADRLRYRAMILVYLALETEQFTEFDAHYFPEREIGVTRLSEPKNYSRVGPPGRTVLCAELPCFPDDAAWTQSDEELAARVQEDLARAGLPVRAPLRRVVVRRLRQAYPVYTADYRENFDRLDRWVEGVESVVTLGRQGLFAHDNTHHTLATAYAAADCLAADGTFDRAGWSRHRREFESHVVED